MKAGNNNTEKQTVAGRRSCRDRSVYRKRAQELVARMTTEEKVGLMSGLDTWHTKPVERLGIPSVMFSDGPHGLRKQLDRGDNLGIGESVPAVCFPAAVTMACTFDPKLVSRVGQAMGEECLQEQVSVILGPGINHKRDPRCGRNFEYYSEDPVVSGTLGSAMVRGIQSTGIGASLKHFAANNQEKRRMTIDARIDEQTLREIYLKAFNQVVKEASPMTVMCSYNRRDGEYNSENRELLTTILREEWEYDGTVISDWGAVHDRTQGIQAGLDLEMPGNQGYNDRKVLRDLQKGKLSMEALDLAAERVTAMALECMEAQQPGFQYDAKEHHALAKECAEKGAVLLKNNGILPACPGESTAILGEMAEKPRFQGAGSSKIHPLWIDTPLEAIREQIPGAEYAPGYRLEKDNDDGEELLCHALEVASRSERVFLFAGLPERYESEGFDREDLRIPENQIRLIRETAKVNPRLTVILMGGAPMEMEWEDEVPSILLLYLGGEACGAAAADLLMGKVNPSGKLAETWPMHLEDVPSYENFPGNEGTVEYREGIWTGYRYYDRARKPVRFSFGHGLSYTKFCYWAIEADRRELSENGDITITVTLQNTGRLEGEETVFLFSSHRSDAVFHPEKELRGFQKIRLRPGETGSVEFTLSSEDLAFYNTAIHNWYAEPGKYILRAGGSSEDLPLSLELTLTTKKRPVVDRRRDVPFYYGDLKDMHVPDDQFAALYGKTLPAPVTRIRRPYGPEHTLENARHNLFGKILLKYVDHLAAKVSQEEEGQEGMMAAAMKEMPLFALVASGEDMFPEHMMNAVLNLLNGHYWNAIQCALKRPPTINAGEGAGTEMPDFAAPRKGKHSMEMQTTKRERISYYSYFFGQNLFYMIIASYISLFLLNHGVNEALAASVVIAPQIWDVINDIIFGRIVDKAHLKGGKFLPWLKISWICIPATTIFIFCMPDSLSVSAKCAWVFIGYCLWSVAYTMCDTPIYALSTAMTEKVEERNSILSIGRLVGTTALVVATLAIEGLYMPLGWPLLSILLSVISMVLMLPILFFGKERNTVRSADAPTLKDMFRALGQNKFLIVFYIAFFLVGVTNTVQTVIPMFAQYVLGSTEKGTILLAMSIIPAIIAAAFIPSLCRKVDKFWLYIGCLGLFVLASIIQFIVGYSSDIPLYITMALRGVGLVGYNVLVYMFTPDCIEYGQYKTGVRQEGITFSIQTSVTKLSGALMNSISLLLLAMFGFKAANADPVTGIVDAVGAQGCWHVLTWISTIGPILAIILLVMRYKLRDKDVNLMAQYNNGEISREECDKGLSGQY